MNITISPRWFTRSSSEPAKVEANIYASKYWQHPFVSLNISQPSSRRHAGQPKLRIDMGAHEARELAGQLLRHAESLEAENKSSVVIPVTLDCAVQETVQGPFSCLGCGREYGEGDIDVLASLSSCGKCFVDDGATDCPGASRVSNIKTLVG